MHTSECCESFHSRRCVGFNRRSSSSGEKEGDAKDKCAEDGGDRGGDATPGFSRSRKLQPGQDRRPLQRFYTGMHLRFTANREGNNRSPRRHNPADTAMPRLTFLDSISPAWNRSSFHTPLPKRTFKVLDSCLVTYLSRQN